MTICKSERLIIRKFTLNDAEFILQLFNQAPFIRYIADKGVRTIDDAKQYLSDNLIASYDKHGFGLYLIALAKTNTAIGSCGLLKRETFNHPDLGFAFLEDYCGRGYAYEAAQAILLHEKNTLPFNTILAVTMPDNISANRLLTKLSFAKTGMLELYNTNNNLYEIAVKDIVN